MTREIIVNILEGEGAEGKGGAFKIPEAREATCFISNPGELLAIARVVKIELKDQYLTLSTAKDERFVFAYGGRLRPVEGGSLDLRAALPPGHSFARARSGIGSRRDPSRGWAGGGR
jgi:hypothetical protein